MTERMTYALLRFLQIPSIYSRVSFVINPGKLFLWVGTNPIFSMEMGDFGSHNTLYAVKR